MLRRHTPSGSTPLGNTLYQELSTLLRRFVSPMMADSALRKAVAECGTSPTGLEPNQLSMVTEHAMVALRLFCPTERLPELMIALAELCDQRRTGRA